MIPPRYQGFTRDQIPVVALEGGGAVRVICGTVQGVSGPVRGVVTDLVYLDVALPAGGAWVHPAPPEHTLFAYGLEGAGYCQPEPNAITPEALLVFGAGDELAVTAGPEGAHFLLAAGRPIGEPIAWRGPVVMNTQEQLRQAFAELEEGTFLKHQAP